MLPLSSNLLTLSPIFSKTMTTKQEMLDRIRSALADHKNQPSEIPSVPEVWKREGFSVDEMTERFIRALEMVQGEVVSCESFEDAVDRITVLLKEIGASKLGVMDRPLSRSVAEKLVDKRLVFAPEDPGAVSPQELAQLDAAVVSPEFLLADTGSCIFHAPVAFDRLTTYIMPVSIIVAEKSMLRESMSNVWNEMKPKLTEAKTGEYVVVTGPSRTADIEKILILGVHGPKRVVVFLLD